MPRTDMDFSRHELTVTQLDGVLIHEFKRPNTRNCMLVFINCKGVMTVTGDLGNWVFCREFHPSPSETNVVSAGYWDEKLEISSIQHAKKYDAEQTMKDIAEFEKDFEDNHGREMNEDEKDWVESLKNNVDDEHEYTYIAYRQKPDAIEYEDVPFGKARHFWLNCVYDGFDAICKLLNDQKIKSDENQY